MKANPKAHVFALDVARAYAVLGVVLIHVWIIIYRRPDFWGGVSWWLAYGLNALSRPAVPVFLMISGWLLLSQQPKTEVADTLKRTFLRIFVPLVAWTTIYFGSELFFFGRRPNVPNVIGVFLSGDIFHLYFLAVLFFIYLLLPLWRSFAQTASETKLKYLTAVLLVVGLAINAAQFFWFKPTSRLNFFTLWVPYLGYFWAGYLISKQKLSARYQRALSLAALATFTVIWLAGYFNLRLQMQGNDWLWGIGGTEYFEHSLGLPVMTLSICFFWWLTRTPNLLTSWTNRQYQSVIKILAEHSYGIYLVHLLVIYFLDTKVGFALDHTSSLPLWVYGFIKTCIVLILSLAITMIISKIPVVRVLVGLPWRTNVAKT